MKNLFFKLFLLISSIICFSCEQDSDDSPQNSVDTLYVFNTDTLFISSTDTLYFLQIDTLYLYGDTLYIYNVDTVYSSDTIFTSDTIVITYEDMLPFPPTQFSASLSNNSAILNWELSMSPDVIGYALYRDNSYIASTDGQTSSYIDSSLSPNTSYCYNLASVDSNSLLSELTQEICLTTGSEEVSYIDVTLNTVGAWNENTNVNWILYIAQNTTNNIIWEYDISPNEILLFENLLQQNQDYIVWCVDDFNIGNIQQFAPSGDIEIRITDPAISPLVYDSNVNGNMNVTFYVSVPTLSGNEDDKIFQIYAGSTDSLIFAMPLQAGDFSVTLDENLLNTNYQYIFKFGEVAPSIHTFTEDIIIYIYRNTNSGWDFNETCGSSDGFSYSICECSLDSNCLE